MTERSTTHHAAAAANGKQGPLTGLRIFEYGEFIAAPYCARLMANLGAEVIKVERPDGGDKARRYGPFPGDVPHPEKSGLFLNLNTDKLGVTLNVDTATGRSVFKRLIAEADILIENNPPRRMEELGFDFQSLHDINPRLIVTSITPFGWTGPYRDFKGHALQAVAGSGIAHRTGRPDRSPLTTPLSQGDYQGAIHGAAATMAAFFGRKVTGEGQHVDISSIECMGTVTGGAGIINVLFGTGAEPRRAGHRVTAYYPWTVLPCKDGYVEVITMQDRHWDSFLEAMGNPEWGRDPRFQDKFAMVQHADELDANIVPWLMERDRRSLWQEFRQRRISYQPVHDLGEVIESDHMRERGYFQEVEHPAAGTLRYPGAPFKMSASPWAIRRPAPLLGEHNELIYCGRLGFDRSDLARLRQASVI
jgi:crotonobetainyl-CoA:carnitine CoA-transferase CaiB-like acyl-CoA transferase